MSHHIATGYAKGLAVIPGDLMALGPQYCVPIIASANLSIVSFHCAAIRITLNPKHALTLLALDNSNKFADAEPIKCAALHCS